MGMAERTVPKPEIAAGGASKVPIRSWPFDIIIGFAKRFRKTAVSQNSRFAKTAWATLTPVWATSHVAASPLITKSKPS